MDETVSFGYWLRRRRKALDLTQQALAERVGCALITIQKIEADERRPSREVAARLAEILAVPLHEREQFLQVARAELAVGRIGAPTAGMHQVAQPSVVHPLPSGTVTFLFTDIAGSTQLWEQQREAMAEAHNRHDAILRMAIERHQGVVFKTIGDAFCAAFAQAPDALAAALGAQRALQNEPWGAIGHLCVRMALHTGVAELSGDDYRGLSLSRVARLMAAGHGGQVLLSRATQELVREHLPPDLTLLDLGEHGLRDLTFPEQIFQLLAPDLPSDFPPLRTLTVKRSNLPTSVTPLIGREREVTAVRELLQRADVRLVTLSGPGGTGKTRLSLQVAAELSSVFTGVWFVDLTPVSDPALVIPAIAHTLGVRQIGGQSILASVQAALQNQCLLLVLDNFEQVLDAALDVAALLAASPQLKVLVTSRALLHLAGEHEFTVPPLQLPDQKAVVPLVELIQYEAVALFVARARGVRHDFQLTNNNAPTVRAICAQVDGLPLAIELAASRCKVLELDGLLARLEHRLKFLTTGAHDLPARHQTIRATIDWSYNLLTAAEQQLFAQLGVFVGGWALEAAEAVCTGSGPLEIDVLDGLQSLSDKSLVQQDPQANRELRFMMLETIREYALERLVESGQAEHTHQQHATYYLTLAEAAETQLHCADQLLWLKRLDLEHDNLRAALRWSDACGDSEQSLRFGIALQEFWGTRGHLSEGRRSLESALRASSTVSAVRAAALLGTAWLAYDQQDNQCGIALGKESLALYRAMEDSLGIAKALRFLGFVAVTQREDSQVAVLLGESLARFQALGNQTGIADVLGTLGFASLNQGDNRQARTYFEECLAIHRKQGDRWASAWPLAALGKIAHEQGEHERAMSLGKEGLALLREREDTFSISWMLVSLGHVALAQGDDVQAQEWLVESLGHFQYLNIEGGVAVCLLLLAQIAATQQHLERAARLFGAGEMLVAATNYNLSNNERADYERALATVRTELDPATFAAAWAEGQAMTQEQAIAYALDGAGWQNHLA